MDEIIKIMSERRKELGFSLRKLDEKTGVCYVHIKKIEAGDVSPKLETLRKLLDALDLHLKVEINE